MTPPTTEQRIREAFDAHFSKNNYVSYVRSDMWVGYVAGYAEATRKEAVALMGELIGTFELIELATRHIKSDVAPHVMATEVLAKAAKYRETE